MEIVWVEGDGSFDFYNMEMTSNGWAVVERRDFMHASPLFNAKRIDNLFIITRGGIIPPIAKLLQEQEAAFMVCQSMESSADDPTQAGKIKNEFFCYPFLTGDRSEHANLFYDLLKSKSQINCFLLNTGWIGEPDVHMTKYENLVVVSEPMSRAAAMTKKTPTLSLVMPSANSSNRRKFNSLAKEELVSIDVTVGDGTEGITARLIILKSFSGMACAKLGLYKLTMTAEASRRPN